MSGGGCKTTPVGSSWFTAVAERVLEFLHVEIVADHLVARAIRPDGHLVDRLELRARDRR